MQQITSITHSLLQCINNTCIRKLGYHEGTNILSIELQSIKAIKNKQATKSNMFLYIQGKCKAKQQLFFFFFFFLRDFIFKKTLFEKLRAVCILFV